MNDFEKALFIIDMNNGFVNIGPMANPEYKKLVLEQLKAIKKTREEGGLVNFVLEGHHEGAKEFEAYPEHCVLGTSEALLIPELVGEADLPNTRTYYKNCINGMLNRNLQDDLKNMKKLKQVVIEGVCADLCVMDFARTMARYFDEIDKDTAIYVVKNAIDTFDAPGHNREEWLTIARKVMEQAGIKYVDTYEDIERVK